MPSIPLKHPSDLQCFATAENTAHLTVFFNTPAKANEHLAVVFGTNSFGGIGELAHLRLPEAVFQAVVEAYPLSTAIGLTRSPDIDVAQLQGLLTVHWPVEPEESAAPAA
jgi:hypothetical protein